jgi:hypothetical protein
LTAASCLCHRRRPSFAPPPPPATQAPQSVAARPSALTASSRYSILSIVCILVDRLDLLHLHPLHLLIDGEVPPSPTAAATHRRQGPPSPASPHRRQATSIPSIPLPQLIDSELLRPLQQLIDGKKCELVPPPFFSVLSLKNESVASPSSCSYSVLQ